MPNKDSSVEKLKKSLYIRDVEPVEKPRRDLHEDEKYEVSDSWDEEEVQQEETHQEDPQEILNEIREGHVRGEKNKKTSILDDERFSADSFVGSEDRRVTSRIIKAVFISSFLFFLLTLGLAGYFLIGGKNQVSCDNVDIVVTGPRTIASGQKLVLDVAVVNNNPVPMRNASIEVRYPEGTRSAEQSSMALPSSKEQVGTIEENERVRTTTSALLYGQEQTDQEIIAILAYEIDDSNASFSCSQPFNVLISTSPVSLTVQGLEEISSGQELELEITVTSNSEEMVPDLRLVADYPYGFEFVSAMPEPDEGNNVWEVGDMTSNMERTVKLHGIVRGQGIEARAIGISVGQKDTVNADGIATILQKVVHPLLVTRPFMDVSLALNGNSNSQFVSSLGKTITGTLTWKNNLEDALHDVEIEAHFDGVMLDLSSVQGDGFFRSIDKTLIWTPQTTDKFRMIEAGEEGLLTFKFLTLPFENNTSATNPSMDLDFSVRARRISDNIPVPQNLLGQSKRTVLFNTDLNLNAYAVYGVGPFTNTGPHPPKVDTQTTYTVVWEVTNSTNQVENTLMNAELPINVNWLGVVSPNTEVVTFNPVTRQIIWSLGTVERGTGYQTEPRKVSFQVSTIPSISQVGGELKLIESLVLQGTDAFTKEVLEKEKPWVNTKLVNDPYFSKIQGNVEE